MRRRTVIAPALLLAAVLAWRHRRARARRAALEPGAAAQPATSAPVIDQPVPRLPGGAPPASRFVSVPWALVDAPPDRPELTVRYADLPGYAFDRVDAQETPTQVFVTVLVCGEPPAGGWFAFREEREATVALSAPLGARELVHGATDPPAHAGGEPNGPSLYP